MPRVAHSKSKKPQTGFKRYISRMAKESEVQLNSRSLAVMDDVARRIAGLVGTTISAISQNSPLIRKKTGRLGQRVLKPRTVGAALLIAFGRGTGELASRASYRGRDAIGAWCAATNNVKTPKAAASV